MSAPLDGGLWGASGALASPDNWADAGFFGDEPEYVADPIRPPAGAMRAMPAASVAPVVAPPGDVVDQLVTALRERPGSRWEVRRAVGSPRDAGLIDLFPSIATSSDADPVWILMKDEAPMLLLEDDGRAHVPPPDQTSLDLHDVVSVLGGGVDELAGLLDFGIAPTIARVRQVRRAGAREADRAANDVAVALPPLLRVTRRSLAEAAAREATEAVQAAVEAEAVHAAASAEAGAETSAEAETDGHVDEPVAGQRADIEDPGQVGLQPNVEAPAAEHIAVDPPALTGRRRLRAAALAAVDPRESAGALASETSRSGTAGGVTDAPPAAPDESAIAPSRRSRRAPAAPTTSSLTDRLVGVPDAAIGRIDELLSRARREIDDARRLAAADSSLAERFDRVAAHLEEAQALGAYVLRTAPVVAPRAES